LLYAPDFEVPAIFRLSPAGNPTALDLSNSTIQPFGIEVDHSASLVVSDNVAGKLFRVNSATGAVRQIGSGAPFDSPYGIDIDPKGRILVADETSPNVIYRVNPDTGKAHPLASGGLLTDATQPAVAPNGKIFVAAGSAGVIRVNPKTGHKIKVAGSSGGYFEGIEVEPPRCFGEMAVNVGSERADKLAGSRFGDVVAGLAGRDVIKGRRGNDLICTGPGNDRVIDTRGKNKIVCGPGEDAVLTNRRSKVANSCDRVTRR
jgi:hypothetical protein